MRELWPLEVDEAKLELMSHHWAGPQEPEKPKIGKLGLATIFMYKNRP